MWVSINGPMPKTAGSFATRARREFFDKSLRLAISLASSTAMSNFVTALMSMLVRFWAKVGIAQQLILVGFYFGKG